jgi:two-component system, OmpR family, sensor kinase
MRAIAFLRRRQIEVAWAAFALANFFVMVMWPRWETIPFHFVWVSLTLVYGFRVWSIPRTGIVLGIVFVATGVAIGRDALGGTQPWDEISEVPLMSAMFVVMVWHARRRQSALQLVEQRAKDQESFLHDVSHELRTPVTIARGHLEVLRAASHNGNGEVEVALDELARMKGIIDRLLLLAKAEQPDFLAVREIEIEPFLEDVFMRWAEVAPRGWRLGSLARGTLEADEEALRDALDALLENAVKYTDTDDTIELRATASYGVLGIEVVDEGCGIPPESLARIFERFARADPSRTRDRGGVGLGLAIVDAIARSHRGRCTVRSNEAETVFTLHLPAFLPTAAAAMEPISVS